MLRSKFVASALGVLLLVVPALSRAGDSSAPPSQALVRINSSGQLEMVARFSKMVQVQKQRTVMKKETRQEKRTEARKIEKDGKTQYVTEDVPVTVQVDVPVTETYTEMFPVYETSIQNFPASTNGFRRDADKAELPLFDLAGNRLSVTAVEDRLHDWTLVLISNSGKALDRKFAALFKPTTIVIGVPPYQAMAMPVYPAPQTPNGALPVPQPAPVAPSAARDVSPALTPVAFVADAAPPQLPNSPEPTFAFAKVWGEKTLALRTESEKVETMTCMVNKEVEQIHEGKPVKVVVCEPRQIDKTIEIRETTRHPLAEVSVTRMPNKELTKSELPSALAVEVLAVVSADGKPVDQLWQRNLRDGAFVIVAPGGSSGGPAMMPVTMPPAPAYGLPPAEAPAPVSPPAGVPVPSSPRVIPLPPPSPTGGPNT